MKDFIQLYFELLQWITNPFNLIPALIFMVVIFGILHWVYYKTNENKYLKIIFGTLYMPLNFAFNVTGLTIIGLELPRETACTKRLKRWKKLPPDSKLNRWRIKFAWAICDQLNKSDPRHC
jgi:hypothetical protein